MIIPDKVLKYT